jgi:hypothetical protein
MDNICRATPPFGSGPFQAWEGQLFSTPFCRIILFAILPVLLAADLLDKSIHLPSIPEEDAFRSPLSENVLKSNPWRAPKKQEERDWRLPPPPPVGWRTPSSSQFDSSSSQATIDLFPRYQSGKPSDYDMIEREEKPLIKMFEFGSK